MMFVTKSFSQGTHIIASNLHFLMNLETLYKCKFIHLKKGGTLILSDRVDSDPIFVSCKTSWRDPASQNVGEHPRKDGSVDDGEKGTGRDGDGPGSDDLPHGLCSNAVKPSSKAHPHHSPD